jgi:hypothetical protein
MQDITEPLPSFPPKKELVSLLVKCRSLGIRYVNDPYLVSEIEDFFDKCKNVRFETHCRSRRSIPDVYWDSGLLEACCIIYPHFISDLPNKFKTDRLYQIAIRTPWYLKTFSWTVLSKNMQSVVIFMGYHDATILPRRSSRFTRFYVINELCKFIERKFMLSNPLFQRTFDKLMLKYPRVGIRVYNLVESFFGASESDNLFTEMAQAYRCKYYRINKNRYRREERPNHFLLTEELSVVRKYARLIRELKKSTSQFSSAKDNDFVRRMLAERRNIGAFIFDFCV